MVATPAVVVVAAVAVWVVVVVSAATAAVVVVVSESPPPQAATTKDNANIDISPNLVRLACSLASGVCTRISNRAIGFQRESFAGQELPECRT